MTWYYTCWSGGGVDSVYLTSNASSGTTASILLLLAPLCHNMDKGAVHAGWDGGKDDLDLIGGTFCTKRQWQRRDATS